MGRFRICHTFFASGRSKLKEPPLFQLYPAAEVRPGTFGHKSINFVNHPDFSRKYRLSGEKEAAVRWAFSPAVISLLMEKADWSIDSIPGWFVAGRSRRPESARELEEFISSAAVLKEKIDN